MRRDPPEGKKKKKSEWFPTFTSRSLPISNFELLILASSSRPTCQLYHRASPPLSFLSPPSTLVALSPLAQLPGPAFFFEPAPDSAVLLPNRSFLALLKWMVVGSRRFRPAPLLQVIHSTPTRSYLGSPSPPCHSPSGASHI